MLVQRNLARTTQHARLVLQKEITSVYVFLDLLVMTVKTVGNNLTQVSKKGLGSLNREVTGQVGGVGRGVIVGIEMWLCFNHFLKNLKHNLVLDVDECKEQSCNENANCENIPGSYKCTCREGFHGDGKICTGDYAKIKNSFVTYSIK